MSDDERNTTMTIVEKHVFQSTTLPKAPERTTRAQAEADEERGVELAAFLALLPNITAEQWAAAYVAADSAARGGPWGASRAAARTASWGASRGGPWGASRAVSRTASWGASWCGPWAAQALVVRDLISVEHFNILTAPMRAAGIDFDNLTGTP